MTDFYIRFGTNVSATMVSSFMFRKREFLVANGLMNVLTIEANLRLSGPFCQLTSNKYKTIFKLKKKIKRKINYT